MRCLGWGLKRKKLSNFSRLPDLLIILGLISDRISLIDSYVLRFNKVQEEVKQGHRKDRSKE
jgi:hypothetical protein